MTDIAQSRLNILPNEISLSMERSRGMAVWLTGLSGAGKTTIGKGVVKVLLSRGLRIEVLDGDDFRKRFCQDLGFSTVDRKENIRRITIAASLLVDSGIIAVVAAISPMEEMRQAAKAEIPEFLEVFVDASLDVCEQRDPKGLYRKARLGVLSQFTGVDAPYEAPSAPDVICSTATESIEESIDKVVHEILSRLAAVHVNALPKE